MLIPRATLERVMSGEVTLAFRRWRRPTVRAGGTLRTALGVVAVDSVDPIALTAIPAEDARRAGYENTAELRHFLSRRPEGQVYRIQLRPGGADPRVALRDEVPVGAELAELLDKLNKKDKMSSRGPWTRAFLAEIAARPGVRAAELAERFGLATPVFKADVRKLKELGLTESLPVGYRLSARGQAVLDTRDD
ncbi:hypothetical protein [Amycolatopsis albispora]|uniref:ASCH domain-containing protein n=1 Tax=Amycolatopsis albispora TaxID=1804986 RepID=A0A344L6E9_9PSEU|nr:hypothetical protein [Amycolatopsis albispora]AXB43623.1 hypothetical protein A4R43_14645 [Amycolatopsis albispora]